MPRPRTVEDDEILAATARVIGEVGPHRLTLAKVAQTVGLAPATLVQRFGSRRGLLLSLVASAAGDPTDLAADLLQRHGAPLAAARAFLLCFASMASTPEELAHHLAFLQMDITDPEFRALTRRVLGYNEDQLTGLLEAAVAAGELQVEDPRQLARTLLATVHGALVSWAICREGPVGEWLEIHLRPLLER